MRELESKIHLSICLESSFSNNLRNSEKWKFYLKGDPVENYSPFPADLISPKAEATVTAGSIKFEWTGSDADSGDTLNYDVYVGSANPPTTKIATNHSSSSINHACLLYTSPSPRDRTRSRMPSSA